MVNIPQFALAALQAEPQLGLLLPCNVVIQELPEGTVASAVDARALVSIDRDEIARKELTP